MKKLLGLVGLDTGLSYIERGLARYLLLGNHSGHSEYARYILHKTVGQTEIREYKLELVEMPSRPSHAKISFPNGCHLTLRYLRYRRSQEGFFDIVSEKWVGERPAEVAYLHGFADNSQGLQLLHTAIVSMEAAVPSNPSAQPSQS